MAEPAAQRIVPGAPPPKPLSKTQKKKRKTKAKATDPVADVAEDVVGDAPVEIPDAVAAALVEKAPEASDIAEGSVAPELVTQPDEVQAVIQVILSEEVGNQKRSPVVDVVHKRLRMTGRKISRIAQYASTDAKELNEDQLRTLKTLPTLETVHKELEEVKKAIETYETEAVPEKARKRLEREKAEQVRLAEAVTETKKSIAIKTSNLLSFLRLHSSVSGGQQPLELSEVETAAIFAAADILLGEEGETKEVTIHGFFNGEGEIHDVPYARLSEITQNFVNPPRPVTPVAEEEVPEPVNHVEASQGSTLSSEPETPVIGLPTSGSFQFMQNSELDGPSFEEGAEWVETTEAPAREEIDQSVQEVVEEPVPEPVVNLNGHAEVPPSASSNAPIDWADDEGGLPSLVGLQAKFGSGSATPDEPQQVAEPPMAHVEEIPANVAPAAGDDDGFTQARGGRGRGRGGFRGDRGYRGGYRGGERGSSRGGERGFRGGHRGEGHREGYRGEGHRGDRGSYRGRSGNGEWRGDGEHRGRGGRGRGRGRGGDREGFHEARGGTPVTA